MTAEMHRIVCVHMSTMKSPGTEFPDIRPNSLATMGEPAVLEGPGEEDAAWDGGLIEWAGKWTSLSVKASSATFQFCDLLKVSGSPCPSISLAKWLSLSPHRVAVNIKYGNE